MMETFDFPVDNSASIEVSQRNLRTDFGDGYTQEAGDGINTRSEAWRISAMGHWESGRGMPVKAMAEFLDRQGGYQAFEWVTPLGATKLFKCRSGYSLTSKGAGYFQLSASFEEVHAT